MEKGIKREVFKHSSLRNMRERVCFPVINRGKLWYDSLTSEQLNELKKWYNDFVY